MFDRRFILCMLYSYVIFVFRLGPAYGRSVPLPPAVPVAVHLCPRVFHKGGVSVAFRVRANICVRVENFRNPVLVSVDLCAGDRAA